MSSGEWAIRITRPAEKDIQKLPRKLREKLYAILTEVIAKNPFEGKKLIGDLAGSYSYCLNYQNRIIYSLDQKKHILYLERTRTHYGD